MVDALHGAIRACPRTTEVDTMESARLVFHLIERTVDDFHGRAADDLSNRLDHLWVFVAGGLGKTWAAAHLIR